MKKYIALSVLLGSFAQASTLTDNTKILIEIGFTDIQTVKHNSTVYLMILSDIEQNISKQAKVLTSIADLQKRMDSQFAFADLAPGLSSFFKYAFAPELVNALSEAQKAAQNNQMEKVLAWVAVAKNELNLINKI